MRVPQRCVCAEAQFADGSQIRTPTTARKAAGGVRHIWSRALQRRGGREVASVMQAVVELDTAVCVAAAQFADRSQTRTRTGALDHVKSGGRRRRPAELLVAASDMLDQGSSVEVCRRQSVSGFSFETADVTWTRGKAAVRRCYGTFGFVRCIAMWSWSSVDNAGSCIVGTGREGRRCRGVVESHDRVGPRTDRN